MAEQDKINLFFTRLLRQLTDVYRECEARKTCTEAVCTDMTKLLKPWPKKEKVKKDPVEAKQEHHGDAAERGDTVPLKELRELCVVDRALSKAQKVRSKYQEKLKEAEQRIDGAAKEKRKDHEVCENNDRTRSSNMVAMPEPSKTTERLPTDTHCSASFELPKIKGAANPRSAIARSRNAPPQKVQSIGVVSQAKLDRLLQKPCLASAPSGRRFTPAHAAAPFRTEPTHGRRAKLTTGGLRRKPPQGDLVHHVESTTLGTRLCEDANDTCVTDDVTKSQRDKVTEEWLQQCVVTVSRPSDCHIPLMTTTEAERSPQTLVITGDLKTLDTQHAVKAGHGANEREIGSDGKEKFFLLQRDGHSLTLPRNLARAASINWKLRHKVQRAALISPVTGNNSLSPAAEFSLKLHNYMSEALSEDSLHLLQRLHALCDIYDALSITLQQLPASQLHDGTSWQEVLRCQKTVEYVFTLFDDLEVGYKDIKAKVKHITAVKQTRSPVDDTHHPSMAEQFMSSRLEVPTSLKYKRKKQLASYTTRLHTLQLLQLCRYTTGVVEQDLLPWLQQMDVDHPSYLAMYRAVYALLCTRGHRFPAMVRDIPEAEEDIQSEDTNDF